ncbi:DUF3710 domain-containing protein [Paeniglutamicibacter antarcticus]|uniref:DUF3710 domain-containing protein n=1 Tax=Arthrobacter terrae TaxID=2935737 RepID=A0A931G7E1_9MICC|nr:DUF3710 domain-containing protein [Arthrobacter terrae]MBG0741655.1 DUF3710 domain-containing protein [Arthrobacter terrae]
MAFGIGKKRAKSGLAADDVQDTSVPEAEPSASGAGEKSATDAAAVEAGNGIEDPADVAYDRATHGPFDAEEIPTRDGYLDLGALLITPHDGLQLRLEVEERSQRVIAVTLDLDGSSLQLQAFAAPRSEGLWPEIREQIAVSVTSQSGSIEELDGTFGPEVLAKLPAEAADGSRGYRIARFIGVDGPRWFLRGVLGGDAAFDREAAATLETLFRAVVVVRGDSPLPPRDLLVLRLPKDAVADGAGHVAGDQPVQGQGGEPYRRGPEITQIG